MILINKECFNRNVHNKKDSELYNWYKLIMTDKIWKKYNESGRPSENASKKAKEIYEDNKEYIEDNIIPFLENGKGEIDEELVGILFVGDFIGNLSDLLEEHPNEKFNNHWIKIIGYFTLAKFVFYDLKKMKGDIIKFAKKNKLNQEGCITQIESRLSAEIRAFNSKHIKFKIILEMSNIRYESLNKWTRDRFITKSFSGVEKIIGIELQENMKFYTNKSGDINKIYDINYFNEMLSYFISYEMLKDEQRHTILNTLNVPVCPYCNRQYITSYEPSQNRKDKLDKLATADLDHFYPKNKFQLFSLSLYNFVPACQICNSRMKIDKSIEILYPYAECFGDEVKFQVIPVDKENEGKALFDLLYGRDDTLNFEKYKININRSNISSKRKEELVEGSIEMFQLEKIYESHKEYAAEIIRTRAIYDNSVHDSIMDTLFKNEPTSKKDNTEMVKAVLSHLNENPQDKFTRNEKNRILYGINIEDDSQDLKKPLGKLTRDLLNIS